MIIYYVEDDEGIRDLVKYTLSRDGYETKVFENGEGFHEKCIKKKPDLILLDIMLPGDDGYKILSLLKDDESTKDIPVILISAKSFEYDKVKGLDLGADDYIVKPFGVLELLSRVKALLRRTKKDAKKDKTINLSEIELDVKSHAVIVEGEEISLTPKEFDLLHYLMLNKGLVCSRETLLDAVWGFSFVGTTRTVDVHIQTLRQKLGKKGETLQTIHGLGYKFGVKE